MRKAKNSAKILAATVACRYHATSRFPARAATAHAAAEAMMPTVETGQSRAAAIAAPRNRWQQPQRQQQQAARAGATGEAPDRRSRCKDQRRQPERRRLRGQDAR